jgi:hypothetical protein
MPDTFRAYYKGDEERECFRTPRHGGPVSILSPIGHAGPAPALILHWRAIEFPLHQNQ